VIFVLKACGPQCKIKNYTTIYQIQKPPLRPSCRKEIGVYKGGSEWIGEHPHRSREGGRDGEVVVGKLGRGITFEV